MGKGYYHGHDRPSRQAPPPPQKKEKKKEKKIIGGGNCPPAPLAPPLYTGKETHTHARTRAPTHTHTHTHINNNNRPWLSATHTHMLTVDTYLIIYTQTKRHTSWRTHATYSTARMRYARMRMRDQPHHEFAGQVENIVCANYCSMPQPLVVNSEWCIASNKAGAYAASCHLFMTVALIIFRTEKERCTCRSNSGQVSGSIDSDTAALFMKRNQYLLVHGNWFHINDEPSQTFNPQLQRCISFRV